jgi:hypothetical protein
MPFPLAHPAAVLPFRRWCPRYLSLASLMIGSLVPDLTNCLDWDYFTHSLVGSVTFCWPFGLILLWAFHRVRAPLVATLPSPHREALLPLCGEPVNSFFVCVLSMLLGIWLHLGWDSFTHEYGWLAHRLGSLIVSLPNQGTVQIGLSRVLWMLSTGVGAALVVAAYLSWLKRAKSPASPTLSTEWRGYATWFVLLLIPAVAGTLLTLSLYLDHLNFGFLLRAFVEFYLALLYLTLAIAGFVLLGRGRIR